MTEPVLYDLDAETQLLGGLLIDGRYIEADHWPAIQGLRPEHFGKDKNQWIFAAMLALRADRMAVNEVTVKYKLMEMDSRKVEAMGGGIWILHYLGEMVAECLSTIYIPHFAKIVLKCAQNRGIGGKTRKGYPLWTKDPE